MVTLVAEHDPASMEQIQNPVMSDFKAIAYVASQKVVFYIVQIKILNYTTIAPCMCINILIPNIYILYNVHACICVMFLSMHMCAHVCIFVMFSKITCYVAM